MVYFLSTAGLMADATNAPVSTNPKRDTRAAVQQVLRQTFKYDPTIRQKAEAEGLVSEDVVRLDPVFVTQEKINPYVVRHLAHQRELFEAGKPSLANGAKIPGLSRADVGVIPYQDLIPSERNPPPRWTLISMPW